MTELHAFRPVSTAFGKARKLLLEPFDIGAWIKLIIIIFLVGAGAMNTNPGNNLQYTFDRGELNGVPVSDIAHALSDTTVVAIILLALVVLLALKLLLSYLRGVFSFVLIDALTSGNIRIVQPFKDNLGRGFKVFVFNVVTDLVSLLVIGVVIVVAVLGILAVFGGRDVTSTYSWDTLSTGGVLLCVFIVLAAVAAIIAWGVLIGLFVGFFYDFGVPLMYSGNRGLRQSISEVWGLVKRQPLEFLVYVIIRWVLEMVIGFVLFFLFVFVLAIFVGVGVVIMLVMWEAAQTSLALMLLIALILIAGTLVLVVVSAIISMPIQVFLRYYSLDFLKSFDPSYVEYTGRMA